MLAGMNSASGNTTSDASSAWTAPAGDLLGGDGPHRHRREHAVFDLARVAEVLHERERDGLHALEDHRARDRAADEQRREVRRAVLPIAWPIFGNT